MLGRPCTVLLVGSRWQPKIQESPVIQSQYFLGWRTSQLSALAVTPDTVCNSVGATARMRRLTLPPAGLS